MPDNEAVYALDEGANKHETMNKEQILAAIAEAIQTGEISGDVNTVFEKIKEQNMGVGIKLWVGTTAQYLALESTENDTIYMLTDNISLKTLDETVTQLKDDLTSGSFKVKNASNVNNLPITRDSSGVLKIGNTIIPQKKILWSGSQTICDNTQQQSQYAQSIDITLNESLTLGDIIEIKFNIIRNFLGEDVSRAQTIKKFNFPKFFTDSKINGGFDDDFNGFNEGINFEIKSETPSKITFSVTSNTNSTYYKAEFIEISKIIE